VTRPAHFDLRASVAIAVIAVTAVLSITAAWTPGVAQAASTAASAEEVVPFEARASDGTGLRGHVYLPKRGTRVGVVLNLSPYWNTAHGPLLSTDAQTDESLDGALGALLRAGFGVALVNIRGTGLSDGCFGWADATDRADAYTIIETLADQPYSNGRIGMYGGSWHGWTQFVATAARPPSLAALVPFSGVIDYWSLATRQGAVLRDGPAVVTKVNFETTLGATSPTAIQHAQCTSSSEHSTVFADLQRTAERTEYWTERDLRPLIEGSSTPTFVASGLDYPGEGHLTQFDGLWDLLQPDRTRFLLGQWPHDYPSNHRDDYHDMLAAWFDQWLRDGPSRLETGVVEYQDDSGAWHEARRWPPPTASKRLHLSSDGKLVDSRHSVSGGKNTFHSAPVDTGRTCGPHQLLYVSEPVQRELLVAGNFRLRAVLESSLSGGNFVATLIRTSGDGSCQDLLGEATMMGRIELDLRHRRKPGQPQDLPVGEPFPVSLKSLALVARVPARDRLVLVAGAGSDQLLPDELQPRIALHAGGTLDLPVVREDR
jgi:uncharacterized protein